MATLCTDADIKKIRPNILTYGITTWVADVTTDSVITGVDVLTEATNQITRILDIRWYRDAAGAHWEDPLDADSRFDIDKVKPAPLNRAAVYKCLELAYQYLMDDSPEPDAFERNSKFFAKQFEKEMDFVVADGIIYDWDADNSFSDQDIEPIQRRLLRG